MIDPQRHFLDVAPGSFEEESQFVDFAMTDHTTKVSVFTFLGDELYLEGPVQVVPVRANEDIFDQKNRLPFFQADVITTRKRRLVEVYFYRVYLGRDGTRVNKLGIFASALAWQGDNQLLHLLQPLNLADKDPMGDEDTSLYADMARAELSAQGIDPNTVDLKAFAQLVQQLEQNAYDETYLESKHKYHLSKLKQISPTEAFEAEA